jgi:hypothetical protein
VQWVPGIAARDLQGIVVSAESGFSLEGATGKLGDGRLDLTVPLATAQSYESMLMTAGVPTDLIIDDTAGHQWLSVAPQRVTQWFETH